MADPWCPARYVCTRVTSPAASRPLPSSLECTPQERTSSSPPTGAGSLVFSVGQALRDSLETEARLGPGLGELPVAQTRADTNDSRGRPTVSTRAVIPPKEESTNLCDGSREPQCPGPSGAGRVQPGAAPAPHGARQPGFFLRLILLLSAPSGEHHLSEGLEARITNVSSVSHVLGSQQPLDLSSPIIPHGNIASCRPLPSPPLTCAPRPEASLAVHPASHRHTSRSGAEHRGRCLVTAPQFLAFAFPSRPI